MRSDNLVRAGDLRSDDPVRAGGGDSKSRDPALMRDGEMAGDRPVSIAMATGLATPLTFTIVDATRTVAVSSSAHPSLVVRRQEMGSLGCSPAMARQPHIARSLAARVVAGSSNSLRSLA
jgi:hypothetical protein